MWRAASERAREARLAAELTEALDHVNGHLSIYQLTIEPGTAFHTDHRLGRFKTPDEEKAAAFFDVTQEVLEAAGMPGYEVSNHAVPGQESRHNMVYWRYRDYVGIGPGAHGRLSTAEGKIATAAERHPETWLGMVEQAGHGTSEQSVLTGEEQADELLLMGLRVTEGVDLTRWSSLSGRPVDAEREAFLIDLGLVERIGNHRLRATPEGMLVLNRVVAELS